MTDFLATMHEKPLEQAVRQVRDMQRKANGRARRFSTLERAISQALVSLRKVGLEGRKLSTFERVVARVYADRLQAQTFTSGKAGPIAFKITGSALLDDVSQQAPTERPSSGRAARLRAKFDAVVRESDEFLCVERKM
jgi:hypothetical protein